jgi:transposase InsO family protein
MADHLRPELPLEALGMTLGIRQPEQGPDPPLRPWLPVRGDVYRAELEARRIVCSMSRVGDCRDNAVAESFFATFETERHLGLGMALLEGFSNRSRRYGSISSRTLGRSGVAAVGVEQSGLLEIRTSETVLSLSQQHL